MDITLKLVRIKLNYKKLVPPPFFFKMIILSMQLDLLFLMNVILDFICMSAVDLRRAR